MAALAEFVGVEHLPVAGLPMPATIKLAMPMSDDELIAFSRRNRPYRIEQNAKGELEIMSPVGGDGSEIEATVIRHLGNWADAHGGHSFSSNGGFRLPDTSVLSPMRHGFPMDAGTGLARTSAANIRRSARIS